MDESAKELLVAVSKFYYQSSSLPGNLTRPLIELMAALQSYITNNGYVPSKTDRWGDF